LFLGTGVEIAAVRDLTPRQYLLRFAPQIRK
jgi:hypothetical protein